MTSTVTNGSTIAIRLPTTRPPEMEGAPAFTLDAPLTGKVVGLRTTLEIETGAQVGKEGHDDRETVNEWSEKIDFGIVGLGTCGSCTSFSVSDAVILEDHEKPSLVVVCSEFETHARNMARFIGHSNLKVLVLPYPLEARPEDELLQIADEYYPQALALLGVQT